MTMIARIVLQDARFAIMRHNDKMQSEEFRASWFSIIGLLRAVGNVLKNEDSKGDPSMRMAINQKWAQLNATKPEPMIFWEFIQAERNRFLKNYTHGISRTVTFPSVEGGLFVTIDCGNNRGGTIAAGSKLSSFISDGPFKGQYERDVALMAADWWKSYLDDIDRLAAEESS